MGYFLSAGYTVLLGCEKLGVSADGCKVVLEEDGAEIDDDEALQAFPGSTLIIVPREKNERASEQDKQATAEQKTPDEGTPKPVQAHKECSGTPEQGRQPAGRKTPNEGIPKPPNISANSPLITICLPPSIHWCVARVPLSSREGLI